MAGLSSFGHDIFRQLFAKYGVQLRTKINPQITQITQIYRNAEEKKGSRPKLTPFKLRLIVIGVLCICVICVICGLTSSYRCEAKPRVRAHALNHLRGFRGFISFGKIKLSLVAGTIQELLITNEISHPEFRQA